MLLCDVSAARSSVCTDVTAEQSDPALAACAALRQLIVIPEHMAAQQATTTTTTTASSSRRRRSTDTTAAFTSAKENSATAYSHPLAGQHLCDHVSGAAPDGRCALAWHV
jgi:hypothetical protein